MDFKEQASLFSTAINQRLGIDLPKSAPVATSLTQNGESDTILELYKNAIQRVVAERSLDPYQMSSSSSSLSRVSKDSKNSGSRRALAAPQHNDITLEMKTQVFLVSNPEAQFLMKQLQSGDNDKAETTQQNAVKLFSVFGAMLSLSRRAVYSNGRTCGSFDVLKEFAHRRRRCCECGQEFSYAQPGLCLSKAYQFSPMVSLANGAESKQYFYMIHTSTREEFADIISGWSSVSDQVAASGLALHWMTMVPAAIAAGLPNTTSNDSESLLACTNNKKMQIQTYIARRDTQHRGAPIALPESLQVSRALLENSKTNNVIYPNVLHCVYALPDHMLDLNYLQTHFVLAFDKASYQRAVRSAFPICIRIQTAKQLHELRSAFSVCENLKTKIDLLQVYMTCILSNVQSTDNRWFPRAGLAEQDDDEKFFVPHVVFLRFRQYI